jgi:hypothetical protein
MKAFTWYSAIRLKVTPLDIVICSYTFVECRDWCQILKQSKKVVNSLGLDSCQDFQVLLWGWLCKLALIKVTILPLPSYFSRLICWALACLLTKRQLRKLVEICLSLIDSLIKPALHCGKEPQRSHYKQRPNLLCLVALLWGNAVFLRFNLM